MQHSKHVFRALAIAASLSAVSGAVRADEPISYKAPGSDTTVTLRGYVKLDAIWSDHSAGVDSVGDQELLAGQIPVGPGAGQHKNDQVTFHSRQSRVSLGTSKPTAYGELTTFIEGDFFGADSNESANSNGFRVRHAFGVLGKLLVGQTWTNFFNEQAYVETLDFGGPVGEIFVRQNQVRWTEKFAAGDWSVSAESPEAVLAVPGSATPLRSDSDHSPDFTARVRRSFGGATYSAGALVRNVRVDSPGLGANSAKWGGAASFSGIVPVLARDDVRFDFNAGNTIGRYQVGAFLPDGYVDAQGALHFAVQRSGYVAYRHFWTPQLRSTVEYGAASSNPPAGTAAGVNQSDRSQHLNLIWSPIPAVNLGGEYIHAQRTVVGGDQGSLHRVQLSAQYSF